MTRCSRSTRRGTPIFDANNYLQDLAERVRDWLKAKTNPTTAWMIIECPEEYLLYRRLKMWANNGGTVPFPTEGGFDDQPAWLMTCLETCIAAERQFYAEHEKK